MIYIKLKQTKNELLAVHKEIVSKVDFMTFTVHNRKNVQLHTKNNVCSNDAMIYKSTIYFSMQFKYINVDKNHNLNRIHFVLSL